MSTPSTPAFRPNFRRGGDAAKNAAVEERRGTPLPDMPEPRRGEPKPLPTGRRQNKYGAKCILCNGWVEGEAGLLAKTDDGKWAAEHFPECPSMAMEAAALDNLPKEGDAVLAQTFIKGQVLYDGKYTLTLDDDSHRTFRLRTQSIEDDFMPGKQVIGYLSGRDNEADYTNFGIVLPDGTLRVWKRFQDNQVLVADAKVFLADPHNPDTVLAAVACYACGRTLTVPASVNNGYGPECIKRFG